MNGYWGKALALAALLTSSLVSADPYTPKHEAGRCSIRGTCGKNGFFGPGLPCPDNGLAKEPEEDVRKQLVELCGLKWSSGPICCESAQVSRPSIWNCLDMSGRLDANKMRLSLVKH